MINGMGINIRSRQSLLIMHAHHKPHHGTGHFKGQITRSLGAEINDATSKLINGVMLSTAKNE